MCVLDFSTSFINVIKDKSTIKLSFLIALYIVGCLDVDGSSTKYQKSTMESHIMNS